MNKATFAAGCFWCVQEFFSQLRGVLSVTSGYTGGHVQNPNYQSVCSGKTGHVEAVQLQFDPSQVSYDTLLDVFFDLHDPTSFDRQGADVGSQYRSVIFFHDVQQQQMALNKINHLNTYYARPIVTQVVQANVFYSAEEYHQDYVKKNSTNQYCSLNIKSKIDQMRQKYNQYLK